MDLALLAVAIVKTNMEIRFPELLPSPTVRCVLAFCISGWNLVHYLYCLRNAYTVYAIPVADGVVYRGTLYSTGRQIFVGCCGLISRCVEYRDSWSTSAIGGLAFSEIADDKKGPESGLGGIVS